MTGRIPRARSTPYSDRVSRSALERSPLRGGSQLCRIATGVSPAERTRSMKSIGVSGGRPSASAAVALTTPGRTWMTVVVGRWPRRSMSSCRLVSSSRRWMTWLATVVPTPRRRTSRPRASALVVSMHSASRQAAGDEVGDRAAHGGP
jgi:hypothetical protein